MKIRPVQPHRKDLLINTEWGIAKEELSKSDARLKGLKHFKGYWVTKEEKKQLSAEYNAYHSINLSARFMILFSFFLFIWALSITGIYPLIGVATALAILTGSIGLLRYRLWGQNVTTIGLIAIIFMPLLFADDKGVPMLFWPISIVCLYSLHNKMARKIFQKQRQ